MFITSNLGVLSQQFFGNVGNYIMAVKYSISTQPRIGIPFTINMDASVPVAGTTYLWTIVNSDTEVTEATSITRNPTFTFNNISRYDIYCVVNNLNTLDNHQRAFFKVLPALPNNPLVDYNTLIDLNAIMDTKGPNFTNTVTVSAINGATSLTTSAAHGVVVNDWFRLQYGAGFYQAQVGTTGTTLVLDRPYEGITETISNSTTRNFGHDVNNSPAISYIFDGDTIDTGSYPSTSLYDKLNVNTSTTIRIRPNYKIAIKGEFLGYFNIKNWVGTFNAPVHFYNIGKVRLNGKYYSLPYPMEWNSKMQNIIFDGKADSSYTHGFELYTHATRQGQAWIIGGRWNDSLIACGVNVVYTGADSAGAFGFDPVFASHSNLVATGTSGASTLTLTNTISAIPLQGRLVIHTVGTTYASATSHYYDYSSYDQNTKVFILVGTLSQTYTSGMTVEVNICSNYNWYATRLWWFDNKVAAINGGNDEGWYIGFNNDSIQSNGWQPYHLEYVKISHNYAASSGRDGIQPASCRPGLEIHDNDIHDAGKKNDFTHTSLLSFNDGNQGMIFRNKFIKGKEMSVIQTGHYGQTCYFFANLWDTRNWTLDAGAVESIFIGLEAGAPAFVDYHFFNNTFITDQRPFCTIQHNSPTTVQSLNFTMAGNIIIQAGTQANYTEVKVNTSPAGGRSGWLINNILGTYNNNDSIQFTNYAGGIYTLNSKSSIAFGAGFDAPARFPTLPAWVFRDINGYKTQITRETITDRTAGYDSGYSFWVIPDLIAPTIDTFYVSNAHPDRIYFTTSEQITASGTSGFTLTGTSRAITGVTIVNAAIGYWQLSGNLSIGDTLTVAYNGTNTWKDVSAAQNSLASFAASAVDNQLVLIPFRVLTDIGSATYNTSIDDLGRYWSNINTFNQSTLYNLVDSVTGGASVVQLYVTQNLNNLATGTIGTGGYNVSSTGYPNTVWRDYHSGGNTTTAAFEFRNLPSTHKYNIKISGSRAATDANRVIECRVQNAGVWSSWVAVDCANNSSLFATFNNIFGDGSNKILCEVRARVSPSSAFSYISVLDLEAIVL